jgi:uncharacterized protein YktB (UPF0637 family)
VWKQLFRGRPVGVWRDGSSRVRWRFANQFGGEVLVTTLGFARADFEVFSIDGFDARTEKIYELIRPRLTRLGKELGPALSHKLRIEFFPHVAKHQRRGASPPDETWVAFGASPQGYMRHGYLALSISGVGIHARAILKPEAGLRPEIARQIKSKKAELEKSFRGTRIQNYKGWNFQAWPKRVVANEEFFEELGDALEKKTGGIDVGFGWSRTQAIRLDRNEVLDALGELAPLYRVIQLAVST